MGLLLVVLLILLLLGAFPRSGAWSEGWGSGPAGLLMTVIVILIVLMLCGVIPPSRFDW